MPFVVDSSVALAWILPDEHGSMADVLVDSLEGAPACAPSLWPLEVGNALLMAQRRKRLTERELDRILKVLQSLAVELDPTPFDQTFPAIVVLARKLGLTTYDAAYLELAQRRGLPLATLDMRLAECARKHGVVVLP